MQTILVYSAVKIDLNGAEWVQNTAGFHHSDQHGFGLMDAYRMTSVARVWPLIPVLLTWTFDRSGPSFLSIPSDGTPLLINITGTVPSVEQRPEVQGPTVTPGDDGISCGFILGYQP